MKSLLLSLLTLLIFSCTSQEDGPFVNGENPAIDTWLVPQDEVFDGGPGKDGIPSVDAPQFVSPSDVNYINDDDLVIAITFDSEIRVFPHAILNWHEIVNDDFDGKSFALTYCPLTGTGINWNRIINGQATTFGVSGLLYNSNLIPYDRATDSNWSQMRLDCVNGELAGSQTAIYPVLETTWATIKEMDKLTVMSTETGFQRNYGTYPYGDYRTNDNNLIFPVSNTDNRRGAKDRVLGIIKSDIVKTYSFESFPEGSTSLISDVLTGQNILVVGNPSKNFIIPFIAENETSYEAIPDDFPNVLRDDKGNTYDVFGRVTDGPSQGSNLSQPTAYMGFWFAWAAFYPNLDLY